MQEQSASPRFRLAFFFWLLDLAALAARPRSAISRSSRSTLPDEQVSDAIVFRSVAEPITSSRVRSMLAAWSRAETTAEGRAAALHRPAGCPLSVAAVIRTLSHLGTRGEATVALASQR